MSFSVVPASVPASDIEWKAVRSEDPANLPALNEAQREEVKRLGLDEESYRRYRLLLRKLVFERQQRQGTIFGEQLEELIRPFGNRFSLATVSRRGTPLGWRVTIRHEQKGVVEFQCPLYVVEALAEGLATTQERENLQKAVLQELQDAGFIEVAS